MDPLSIATGVGGLIDLCLKAGFAIKAAREGSKTVDAKIGLLDGEIRGYTQVLELMSSTLQDPMIASSFQSTGHIGSHWRSILALIQDSSDTLERLNTILRKVDKSASVMGSTRKHFRLLFAADEIDAYQKTIKTYRDTMQMSVQTIILWNQVFDRPAQVNMAIGLDDLTNLIRELAVDMNSQIASLRTLVQEDTNRDQAQTLSRMKHCIETAADVVSSASTALGLDDRATVVAPSELGDLFGSRNDEAVMRWMDESMEEPEAPIIFSENTLGGAIPDISTLTVHDNDLDDDVELELELIQVYKKRASDLIANENWPEAAGVLERGLARVRKQENRLNRPNLRPWFCAQLMVAYRKQKSWDKLRDICLEYMQINSPNTAYHDIGQYYIAMLNITFAYGGLRDRTSFKMYLKRAIAGFMKMGEEGESALLPSLRLMMSSCECYGEASEGEAYGLMYDELKGKIDSRAEAEHMSNGRPGIGPTAEKREDPTTESEIPDVSLFTVPKETSPTPLAEFVNVHMIISGSHGDTCSSKIRSAIDSSDVRLVRWRAVSGYHLSMFASVKISQGKTKLLLFWETKSPPRASEYQPLFQIPESTIYYDPDIKSCSWRTSWIELKPWASMPLCILIALRMIKVDGKFEYDFGGMFDLIQRYFYDPRHYSTPIIFLTLIPRASQRLEQADPEVPPSMSAPRWMGGESERPTRGYYKFFRSLEDPAGIREVFEFIAGRSWEGRYFGPPQSPA